MDARKTALRLTGIVLLALAVRVAFILTLDNSVDVWGDWWDELGWRLAQGQGFWVPNPYFPAAERFYSWRAPGFPFFLSLIYRVAGHSFLAAKIALAVVGALTAPLLFGLGTVLAGPAVGWWAACIYAVYPAAIFWTGYLAPETLTAFLFAAMVLFCLVGAERQKVQWFVSAGFVLGVGVLSRSAFTVLLPAIGAWTFLSAPFWDHSRGGWPSNRSPDCPKAGFLGTDRHFRVRAFLLFVAGCMVVVLPWMIRNHSVHRRLVLASTEGGIVCYIANNERSLSEPSGYWNPPATYFAGLNGLSEVDIDRHLYREAFSYIRRNPGEFVVRVADRFVRYWRLMPHSFSGPGGPYRRYLIWFSSAFMVPLFALGIYGVVLSLQRWRIFSLTYLAVLVWSVPNILFFKVVIRYREPIMPFVLIFAAMALNHLTHGISQRKLWGPSHVE